MEKELIKPVNWGKRIWKMQTAPAKGQSVFDTGIVTRAANTTTARNETSSRNACINAMKAKLDEEVEKI